MLPIYVTLDPYLSTFYSSCMPVLICNIYFFDISLLAFHHSKVSVMVVVVVVEVVEVRHWNFFLNNTIKCFPESCPPSLRNLTFECH